jgi:DNA-directed RNA polymerase alpha subunit
MPPRNRKYRRPLKSGPDTSTWTAAEREAHLTTQRLDTPIAEMKLSVRVINTLEDNNVLVARELMTQTYETLLAMKNFGEKTLTEVRTALVALGLDPPVWTKPLKPQPSRATRPKGRRDTNPLDW